MEFAQYLLLEEPSWVVAGLVVVELALAGFWLRRRTRPAAVAMGVVPLLAGGILLLAALITTDRETLQQALQRIAEDYQNERLDAVANCFDDNYEGFGGNKSSLLLLAKQTREAHAIRSVRLTRIQCHVEGQRAETRVTSLIRVDPTLGGETCALAWTIDWVRRDAGWRIRHVEEPRTVVPGWEPADR